LRRKELATSCEDIPSVYQPLCRAARNDPSPLPLHFSYRCTLMV
jgi:hypothetical protein